MLCGFPDVVKVLESHCFFQKLSSLRKVQFLDFLVNCTLNGTQTFKTHFADVLKEIATAQDAYQKSRETQAKKLKEIGRNDDKIMRGIRRALPVHWTENFLGRFYYSAGLDRSPGTHETNHGRKLLDEIAQAFLSLGISVSATPIDLTGEPFQSFQFGAEETEGPGTTGKYQGKKHLRKELTGLSDRIFRKHSGGRRIQNTRRKHVRWAVVTL